jgi:hypothetical protein
LGLELEKRVAWILRDLVADKKISVFKAHPHYSEEDQHGKDFTVEKQVDGKMVSRSFGVTISRRSWIEARLRHQGVPQFCFPIGVKPETIEKRILGLFKPVVERR